MCPDGFARKHARFRTALIYFIHEDRSRRSDWSRNSSTEENHIVALCVPFIFAVDVTTHEPPPIQKAGTDP
jgi:hypothetical protein